MDFQSNFSNVLEVITTAKSWNPVITMDAVAFISKVPKVSKFNRYSRYLSFDKIMKKKCIMLDITIWIRVKIREIIAHCKSAVKNLCAFFKKSTLSFVIFQDVSLKEKEPEQIHTSPTQFKSTLHGIQRLTVSLSYIISFLFQYGVPLHGWNIAGRTKNYILKIGTGLRTEYLTLNDLLTDFLLLSFTFKNISLA